MASNQTITVEITVNSPVEKTWECWTSPSHIKWWNNASTEWYTPHAENKLAPGGRFVYRMEARDGSMGFDFSGMFTLVERYSRIDYLLDDDRKVQIYFIKEGSSTRIREIFEAEQQNSIDLQRTGWQAILDNFRTYAESRLRFTKLQFETTIHAPASKVYELMTDKAGYSSWTSIFNSHSHYEGSWEKGAWIRFLGRDEEGNVTGMASLIRENIPTRFISILHQDALNDGLEEAFDTEVEDWSGALEEYFFEEKNGKTKLTVSMDTTEMFRDYFADSWPRALEKIRVLCENTGSN